MTWAVPVEGDDRDRGGAQSVTVQLKDVPLPWTLGCVVVTGNDTAAETGAGIRARLSAALYAIHKPSRYYTGLTPEGELHLLGGGSIGGDDGMPMSVGMLTYSCCLACNHANKKGDAWPCDTVKLLLEAGVVDPVGEAVRDA